MLWEQRGEEPSPGWDGRGGKRQAEMPSDVTVKGRAAARGRGSLLAKHQASTTAQSWLGPEPHRVGREALG